MMQSLSEITIRLKELPEQRKLKALNSHVQTLTTKLDEIYVKLNDSLNKRTFAQVVFPDEEFSKAVTATKAAARQAANLKEALEDNFSEVANRATEEKVTRLADRVKQAHDDLAKSWPSLMQRQLKSYEAIAEAAATLPGGAALASIMQRLRQHADKPPTSHQMAESISKDLTSLRESIDTLGLKGEAGKFLIKAAKGLADPRDLFKDEIKNYFDEKDLWHVLAVKIK
jgi:hypothetical protein